MARVSMLNPKSKLFPFVFFAAAAFQVLLCGGITFGWATVVPVFKAEGFFYHLCETVTSSKENRNFPNGSSTVVNASSTNNSRIQDEYKFDKVKVPECAYQRERLNLIFNLGVFTVAAGALPVGIFIDKFGPRISVIVGCVMYALAGIGMVTLRKGIEDLLFPIFMLFSLGGTLLAFPLFQTANIVFGKLKSMALCVLNGAFDSSSIVLVIFKLIYDSGVSLRNITIFYSSISLISVLFLIIFLIPAYKTLLSLKASEFSKSQTLQSYVGTRLANHDASEFQNQHQAATDMRMSLLLDHNKISDDAGDLKKNEVDNAGTSEKVYIVSSTDEFPDSLRKSILSPISILQFLFLSILQLRMWFFIGSLNNYLNLVLNGNKKDVGRYLEFFGYIQLGGIIVSTIIGLIFDKNMIGRKDVKQAEISRRCKLQSAVLPFALTTILGTMLSALAITESVYTLIPIFVCLVFMRGFLFASNASLVGMAFKPEYFGRMFGAIMFFSSIVGLLQYPCAVVTEKYFGGNPYWVNVIMLILAMMTSFHPIYLWFYTRDPKKTHLKESIISQTDTDQQA